MKTVPPSATPVRKPLGDLTKDDDAQIVALYGAYNSAAAIADTLGLWNSTVLRVLRRNGVVLRSPYARGHRVRHDALDDLTPEAAYWCGLLFADGSVVTYGGRRNPQVVLALTASDRGHLEKFRAFLGGTQTITDVPSRLMRGDNGKTYHTRPTCRFVVTSQRLAERMCALGRYEGPVDERLVQSRDFWRGTIDGDGHVGISCRMPAIQLSGSRRLLTYYADFVNVPGARRPLHVNWARTSHSVSATCGTAERIVDLLYRDAPTALDRKAVMAERIMRLGA